VVDVDRLEAEIGSTIELRDVLLLSGEGTARVGTPLVDGAVVRAEVLEHGRDAKVIVFKYKNKTRYRRRIGHRQDFTRLAIRDILVDGETSPVDVAEKKPKPRARKRPAGAEAATEKAPKSEDASVETVSGTAEPEAESRPKRSATARSRTSSATAGRTARKPRAAKVQAPEEESAAEPAESRPEEE
jgi:large subunit ribosomal protein L21